MRSFPFLFGKSYAKSPIPNSTKQEAPCLDSNSNKAELVQVSGDLYFYVQCASRWFGVDPFWWAVQPLNAKGQSSQPARRRNNDSGHLRTRYDSNVLFDCRSYMYVR